MASGALVDLTGNAIGAGPGKEFQSISDPVPPVYAGAVNTVYHLSIGTITYAEEA